MKKNILIITKDPKSKGGVVNYYNHFFKAFNSNDYELKWFTVGSRPKDYDNRLDRKLRYTYEFTRDILSFIKYLIINKRVKIVQISPSFFEIPLIRDVIYFLIAKLFRKKTVVFFRGWSVIFQQKMYSSPGIYKYILKILSNVDAAIILANKFKQVLKDFGFREEKIYVSRTMFVKSDIVKKVNDCSKKHLKYIFIARVSIEKGIVEIIEALNLLKQKNVFLNVDIYGHYANHDIKLVTKKLIKQYKLESQICFKGFISGKEKYDVLANANIFLFPTYREGCPNSVIEALASGLFVISTPVGAIDELVIDKKNGLITPVKNTEKLVEAIFWAENNKKSVLQIGERNKLYAHKSYEQDVIIKQIREIYKAI